VATKQGPWILSLRGAAHERRTWIPFDQLNKSVYLYFVAEIIFLLPEIFCYCWNNCNCSNKKIILAIKKLLDFV